MTNAQVLLEVQAVRSVEAPRRPKQVQHRLRDNEVSELVARYVAGARLSHLANDFRVNPTTVDNILVRAGVDKRPWAMTADEIAEAVSLYEAGRSTKAIGEQLGRHPATVWLALKAAGVELRRPWERESPLR